MLTQDPANTVLFIQGKYQNAARHCYKELAFDVTNISQTRFLALTGAQGMLIMSVCHRVRQLIIKDPVLQGKTKKGILQGKSKSYFYILSQTFKPFSHSLGFIMRVTARA